MYCQHVSAVKEIVYKTDLKKKTCHMFKLSYVRIL